MPSGIQVLCPNHETGSVDRLGTDIGKKGSCPLVQFALHETSIYVGVLLWSKCELPMRIHHASYNRLQLKFCPRQKSVKNYSKKPFEENLRRQRSRWEKLTESLLQLHTKSKRRRKTLWGNPWESHSGNPLSEALRRLDQFGEQWPFVVAKLPSDPLQAILIGFDPRWGNSFRLQGLLWV